MGKRSSQKKNAAMLDSDDTDSVSSSSSTIRSDGMFYSGAEEVHPIKESLLDQCLDALYEKRGSTRETALASIIEAFESNLQHEFVDKKFATLLDRCLNSIKKGSAREIALASRVIGLLSLTIGPGVKSQEILEESLPPIVDALKTRSEASKISSLLECLAIITFVGGEEPEKIEKSMQIMWQVAHPKLGPNVATPKPLPKMITMVISAWSFLLTTVDDWTINPKNWKESMSYLSTLLDKEDRLLRIAAGEGLALLFEMGCLENFCAETETKTSNDTTTTEANDSRKLMYVNGIKNKILNQVRVLSTEAAGKGTAKKDLSSQRNTFRDILDLLEDGYAPEASMKIGGESLNTDTWVQLIQLNFLKHFLGGGFVKHMQENEFLHDVFGFMPKKKVAEHRLSESEKRMYKSRNSAVNKARTQLLNKQRAVSQNKNAGHFVVGSLD